MRRQVGDAPRRARSRALSAVLAFLSALIPVLAGTVDWHQATTFHLTVPFHGVVRRDHQRDGGALPDRLRRARLRGGRLPRRRDEETRRATCPRAMFASAGMASLYFVALPVIWLGVARREALDGRADATARPDVRAAAGRRRPRRPRSGSWSSTCSTARCSRSPARRARCRSSPRTASCRACSAARNRPDAPWVATLLTAGMAIAFLLAGDPVWVIAAANFTYLIGISLPSVAVWLLRRNAPELAAPVPRAARHDRARPGRRRHLGAVDAARLPAVRPADRARSASAWPTPARRSTPGAVERPPARRAPAACGAPCT